MSKIKYSSFPKLIKLSDSIKSFPSHFGGNLVGFPYAALLTYMPSPTKIPLNKKAVTKFGRYEFYVYF